jgi:outer membrane protein insertion porin family
VSGGYSTTQGFIGEVSVSESNFLGRGQAVRLSVQAGQRARGVTFSFTEPYFLDQRISAGFDVFAKKSDAYNYAFYGSTSIGGTLRFGIPITDEISFSPHYSIYETSISIPNNSGRPYNDCNSPIFGITPIVPTLFYNCVSNGEASLAIKESQGTRITSLVGYSLAYNSLDNYKNPKNGFHGTLSQDVAGLGGNTRFVRTTGDIRYFHEIPYVDNVVGIARLQGGNMFALGGYQFRVMDNFNLGPSLVRGFAPGGLGPRDISNPLSYRGNSLGGTNYVGGSLEVQFPIWGLPKDIGLRGALFADAGTLWGYHGSIPSFKVPIGVYLPCFPSQAPFFGQGSCINLAGNSAQIRSSVGASLLWQSPLGPIRFDYAVVTSKAYGDVTQRFRFSGGTNF